MSPSRARTPWTDRTDRPLRRRGTTRRRIGLAAALALVSGAAAGAATGAPTEPEPTAGSDELRIADVSVSGTAEREALMASGLDVLELTPGAAEVLLHGPADDALLADGGWDATVRDTRDERAGLATARASEARLARAAAADVELASDLPSGRVSYRTLEEAEQEMRDLAAAHPDLIELVELPRPTLLGRPVLALEIAADVEHDDGRPVFLTSGLHHAREWPTLEFTLELATEAVESYGTDDRYTALLESTRMLVIPAVNPDGYDLSRERVHEMKRKNCRVRPDEVPTAAECAAAENDGVGVDLNRNYAAFWGGPGSSADTGASNHHGADPVSEPEIANMVDLMNAHQVMVAVNNHTPDARLLRAPSSPLEPVPAEVELYDDLAQDLGGVLGWETGPWTEVYYVASGVAEQQGLYVNGTFGFTPELTPGFSGLERFHPPYEYVVEQWSGTGYYEGSSAREALLLAWEATADTDLHGLLTGTSAPGAELTISKQVPVDSSPVQRDGAEVVLGTDGLIETTMTVPADGEVAWHVLPSARQSQYGSVLLAERWTLTCDDVVGETATALELDVARGETVPVALSGCSAQTFGDLAADVDAAAGAGVTERAATLLGTQLERAERAFRAGEEATAERAVQTFRSLAQRPGLVTDDAVLAELLAAADRLLDALAG